MAKKTAEWDGIVNANLGVRIPLATAQRLGIKHGDVVKIRIEVER